MTTLAVTHPKKSTEGLLFSFLSALNRVRSPPGRTFAAATAGSRGSLTPTSDRPGVSAVPSSAFKAFSSLLHSSPSLPCTRPLSRPRRTPKSAERSVTELRRPKPGERQLVFTLVFDFHT